MKTENVKKQADTLEKEGYGFVKTETKLARENIEQFEIEVRTGSMQLNKRNCQEHKQACQRWLEFLENFRKKNDYQLLLSPAERMKTIKKEDKEFNKGTRAVCRKQNKVINKKIQDLKTAIKEYERNGIEEGNDLIVEMDLEKIHL